MTAPQRLVDADDEFERDLIRSAHADRPSKRALERVLLGLGVEMVSLPSAAAAPLTSAKAGGSIAATLLVKWGAIGVAIGLATTGGAELVNRRLDPPRAAAHLQSARSTHAASRPVPPLPVSAAAPSKQDPSPAATLEGRPHPAPTKLAPTMFTPMSGARTSAPGPNAGTRSVTGSRAEEPLRLASPQKVLAFSSSTANVAVPSAALATLSEEMGLLDQARRSLSSGDSLRALATLARYERAFPRGALGPEASVLKVRALLAGGDRVGAEALARRVIEQAPRTEHAGAVRAALGL